MTLDAQTKSFLATAAVGAIGAVGTIALCACLFFKNYADPAVLTALIGVVSTAIGTLARSAGPTATTVNESTPQNNQSAESPKP